MDHSVSPPVYWRFSIGPKTSSIDGNGRVYESNLLKAKSNNCWNSQALAFPYQHIGEELRKCGGDGVCATTPSSLIVTVLPHRRTGPQPEGASPGFNAFIEQSSVRQGSNRIGEKENTPGEEIGPGRAWPMPGSILLEWAGEC
ncbi:hypothetical protein Droror1_Dr00021059 [Drosera rotundifolia]